MTISSFYGSVDSRPRHISIEEMLDYNKKKKKEKKSMIDFLAD